MKHLVCILAVCATMGSAMAAGETADSSSVPVHHRNSTGKIKKSAHSKDTITTASGLKYIVIKEGNGVRPTAGTKVKVNYTGKFLDGRVFDSSIPRGEPFEFTVGAGQVIKGWDEAFLLMSKGEKCTLIIPPDLAYGPGGMGPIPPNATLIFDVELIDF